MRMSPSLRTIVRRIYVFVLLRFIDGLTSTHMPLVLVTRSTWNEFKFVLDELGLRKKFNVIFDANSTEPHKPHPSSDKSMIRFV